MEERARGGPEVGDLVSMILDAPSFLDWKHALPNVPAACELRPREDGPQLEVKVPEDESSTSWENFPITYEFLEAFWQALVDWRKEIVFTIGDYEIGRTTISLFDQEPGSADVNPTEIQPAQFVNAPVDAGTQAYWDNLHRQAAAKRPNSAVGEGENGSAAAAASGGARPSGDHGARRPVSPAPAAATPGFSLVSIFAGSAEAAETDPAVPDDGTAPGLADPSTPQASVPSQHRPAAEAVSSGDAGGTAPSSPGEMGVPDEPGLLRDTSGAVDTVGGTAEAQGTGILEWLKGLALPNIDHAFVKPAGDIATLSLGGVKETYNIGLDFVQTIAWVASHAAPPEFVLVVDPETGKVSIENEWVIEAKKLSDFLESLKVGIKSGDEAVGATAIDLVNDALIVKDTLKLGVAALEAASNALGRTVPKGLLRGPSPDPVPRPPADPPVQRGPVPPAKPDEIANPKEGLAGNPLRPEPLRADRSPPAAEAAPDPDLRAVLPRATPSVESTGVAQPRRVPLSAPEPPLPAEGLGEGVGSEEGAEPAERLESSGAPAQGESAPKAAGTAPKRAPRPPPPDPSVVLTPAQARRLPGPNRGLIFITEKATGNQAAREFAAGTEGALDDIVSKKSAVPAMRYDNPNPKGVNFIKLDGFKAQVAADGSVTLIDAKTKLAIFHRGAQGSVLKTLERLRLALAQNPGYKVVYEFPTESSAEAADKFIQLEGFGDVVSVRVRGP